MAALDICVLGSPNYRNIFLLDNSVRNAFIIKKKIKKATCRNEASLRG